MPGKKPNILFVCTVNRMRSATAHTIYAGDNRFSVKSAGTDIDATVFLSADLMDWADVVIVMEQHHSSYIRDRYPEAYHARRVVCLHIPDEYEYMQPELIVILKEKVEEAFRRGLLSSSG